MNSGAKDSLSLAHLNDSEAHSHCFKTNVLSPLPKKHQSSNPYLDREERSIAAIGD